MIIIDIATNQVVATRSEYWPTYDFGPDLAPMDDYELVATAHSSWWAGGSSSSASIVITVGHNCRNAAYDCTVYD